MDITLPHLKAIDIMKVLSSWYTAFDIIVILYVLKAAIVYGT